MQHDIVSGAEWLAARQELLAEEILKARGEKV